MSTATEATASLVVLEVVRVQGNGEIRLSPDELHALILEALNLSNMEIPYAVKSDNRQPACDPRFPL